MAIEIRRTSTVFSQMRALMELFGGAITLAYGWRDRSRQRRALHRLDDRMLRDIGLSRADVEYEASKPFCRG